ncbi:MAG: type III-B CRISPR-associated protein Cas10/Cmr2 [Saprospiraceae bacterium]
MTKSLLLFTLGPVQSFIAQARKTQDLYAGSRLLSDLIKVAIEAANGTLIFPHKGDAMPNRFLMELSEAQNTGDLQAFGQKVENAVRDKWREIAEGSLKGLRKPDGFDQQITSHLEIFWVIEPLGNNYKAALDSLERQLAAIKNVRAFAQFNWQNDVEAGERGRKCSLDGQRNVQFYRPKNGQKIRATDSPLFSTEGGVCIQDFPSKVLQPGEGLSAVSFVKRKYERNGAFDSTAEIALLDALNSLEKDTAGSILLREYRTQMFSEFNAQLFYKDSLTSDFLNKQGILPKNGHDDLEKVREKLNALEKASAFKFQKYYAVLTFDGDDMGKWLSGEKQKDQSQLRAFQTKFAECLADFAKAAKTRLDSGSGQTVYAGGDDFLGFVNLNHLLPVLADLRRLFSEKVDTPLTDFKTEKISFSAGICVAHYKEPLSLVLQEAKNAQKAAKNLDKKDAFAISVIKGSGESHTTALPFGENAENVVRLESLVCALVKEEFSNNFIKTMRLEFERMMDFGVEKTEFEDKGKFKEIFETEFARLLKRAANNDEKKAEAKQKAEYWMKFIRPGKDFSVENFFQTLHVADFFQRQLDKIAPPEHNQTT